jgi:predicted amidohydrolase YtcJ
MTARSILFRNARLFDGEAVHENTHVLVEGDRIRVVSEREIKSAGAETLDLGGRTLMPGLIDAHFHAYATDLDLAKADQTVRSLHALEAHARLEASLQRGRPVPTTAWRRLPRKASSRDRASSMRAAPSRRPVATETRAPRASSPALAGRCKA